MTTYELETVLTVCVVAAACAVPGVFLVLRKMVMVGDAISHVLLLGIVIAFFIVDDPSSPWLILGAASSGVLAVALIELLQSTKQVKEDAAIGLVFPALFSVAVILVSMFAKQIHLDVDRVLFGNAELVTFNRYDRVGPKALVNLGVLFSVNVLFVLAFYKVLKLSIFDAGLAATLGFLPGTVHYALMMSVSLTTVAAFDAVGSVLVLACFAVPCATARLLTDRLAVLLMMSVAIAVMTATAGTMLAFRVNTNIAGTVATMMGVLFAVTLLVAPQRGLIAEVLRRFRQKRSFHETMLVIHLLRHEGTAAENDEAGEAGLHRHLAWSISDATTVAKRAMNRGLITTQHSVWKLTAQGRTRAKSALNQPNFLQGGQCPPPCHGDDVHNANDNSPR